MKGRKLKELLAEMAEYERQALQQIARMELNPMGYKSPDELRRAEFICLRQMGEAQDLLEDGKADLETLFEVLIGIRGWASYFAAHAESPEMRAQAAALAEKVDLDLRAHYERALEIVQSKGAA
jgi:hypothetical protein